MYNINTDNIEFVNYIKVVRPKNLLIVALTQILIYLVYLKPLTSSDSSLILDGNLWVLFVIDTVLIAAGGYIINDLMDQKADLFNKPDKIYIGTDKITTIRGWIYYSVVIIIGFIIAFIIAFSIAEIHLLLIYPFAVGLLFLYSVYFKRLPLIGNLIVSLFCAFVPGIIWYAEFDTINNHSFISNNVYDMIMHLFPVYISFAFLSTFIREIIKDIEDMEGDQKSDYQTLPIVVGVHVTMYIALSLGIVLLGSYGFWFFGFSNARVIWIGIIIVLGLIFPTIYILKSIFSARSTSDYSAISKMLKYLMIVSLFIFLYIPFILKLT